MTELPLPGSDEQPALVVSAPASAPTGRSRRSRFGIAVGLLALLVAVLGLGDWAARNIEMSRLLDAVERSEAAMGVSQDTTRATIQKWLRANDLQKLGDKVPAKLAVQFQEIASEAHDQVAQAGEQVASVSFLPWHDDLIDAQAAYLDHNQAWVDHLAKASDEGAVLVKGNDEINSTWEDAEVAMRAAVPTVPFPGIQERVDLIFVDTAPAGGGSTVMVSRTAE